MPINITNAIVAELLHDFIAGLAVKPVPARNPASSSSGTPHQQPQAGNTTLPSPTASVPLPQGSVTTATAPAAQPATILELTSPGIAAGAGDAAAQPTVGETVASGDTPAVPLPQDVRSFTQLSPEENIRVPAEAGRENTPGLIRTLPVDTAKQAVLEQIARRESPEQLEIRSQRPVENDAPRHNVRSDPQPHVGVVAQPYQKSYTPVDRDAAAHRHIHELPSFRMSVELPGPGRVDLGMAMQPGSKLQLVVVARSRPFLDALQAELAPLEETASGMGLNLDIRLKFADTESTDDYVA